LHYYCNMLLLLYTSLPVETGNTGQSARGVARALSDMVHLCVGPFFCSSPGRRPYHACIIILLSLCLCLCRRRHQYHYHIRLGVALNRRRTTTCARAVHEQKRARWRNGGRADSLSRRVMPTAGWFVDRRRPCGAQNTTCVRAFSVRDLTGPVVVIILPSISSPPPLYFRHR